jgi:Bacterial toxin 34
VDYSKIPAGFKKGYNLWDLPTSPPERAKEHSNGAMPVAKSSGVSGKAETGTARNEQVVSGSQPVRVAQAGDAGMDDGFWIKALVTAGLAIYEGNKLIMTGSVDAVDALYRNWKRTHQDTTKPPQVLKASQRGRQGNVGDSGIVGEAQELIAQAKAQGKELEMKDALAQLMKKARQSNNGKGDPAREAKIRATQKAEDARGSRESKDGKKKTKGEGKKEDKKDKGNKGKNQT